LTTINKRKNMEKITFLGPVGATFSHDAYNILAKLYDAPEAIIKGESANCIPAPSNGEVLKLTLEHGGYGAIAMETLAEGRVAEPLESFIDLLKTCKKTDGCPLCVIGAIKMRLHFCLMVRPEMIMTPIRLFTGMVCHSKSLGPCRDNIGLARLATKTVDSNGEAARLVAEDSKYATWAALGPKSAAEKYGLRILHGAFESGEAITTFFLLGPKEHKVLVGKENRALIVFKAPHKPGGLVRSLIPFEQEGLNLIQIHSVHVGNHTYNFAIEVEVGESQLQSFEKAMKSFENHVEEFISFGPFEVLER
jgi:prephenate dehydratase